jgi:hypothetical protein
MSGCAAQSPHTLSKDQLFDFAPPVSVLVDVFARVSADTLP